MIILDSYALIALLRDEAAAGRVADLLHSDLQCGLPAVALAEVVDSFARVDGFSSEETERTIEPLLDETVEVLDVTSSMAWRCGWYRKAHYRKRVSELSLADCFVLAACGRDDSLATGDKPLIAAAKAEGIGVAELP